MIVGIDLGTTTSEIAYIKNGKPVIIREIPHSARGILPSVVGINQHGQVVVGDLAERLLTGKPEFAVAEVKRLMGKDEGVHLGSDTLTPQEVSAMILRYLKQEAEKYLGEPVEEAVITVPAYFNAIQRHATRDAGELAGLKVRRLVNEPTAAALAYGIERPGVEEKILVYDLGGGTLDVTVLELSEGILDVLASTGNAELGGKDFDERLVAHLQAELRRSTGIDAERLTPPGARLRLAGGLKAAAKKAKEELSSIDATTVYVPNVGISDGGDPIDFEYTLTRPTLDRLIRDLVESTRVQMDEALGVKGLLPADIDVVLMVGGSTRVALVREFVSLYFGGKPLRTEISPEEAVALGAAVLSGIESREIDPGQLVLTDVSAHTLGVAMIGEQDGEWLPNTFSPLIRKQQTIPRTERQRYSTAHDDQRWFKIEVYQGDSQRCEENLFIGNFDCPIAEPGPAGQPIEIEFSYDLSGEVSVTGRDVRSGQAVTKHFRIAGNLSGSDKREAQDRVNRLWGHQGTGSAPASAGTSSRAQASDTAPDSWKKASLYPKVSALMTHAEQRLGQLPIDVRPRVSHLVESMKAALLRNDADELARHEQVLTDVLFELD